MQQENMVLIYQRDKECPRLPTEKTREGRADEREHGDTKVAKGSNTGGPWPPKRKYAVAVNAERLRGAYKPKKARRKRKKAKPRR